SAAAGDRLSGVEVARSSSSTIYLTLTNGTTTIVPKLAQSTDGGAHWTVHDLSATLGTRVNSVGLIGVDPTNANKVFLRVGARGEDGGTEERIAVTTDGGATLTTPLVVPGGVLTAFTRTAAGHLIVGGLIAGPIAYRSTDGGATFVALPTPPNIKGLS